MESVKPSVGVVAIGRNEGHRLVACLASARRDCDHVVYVDSGSSDSSVATARKMGVHVIELDLSRPFTAARARNEGFAKLMEVASDLKFVQFVDGDCEIVDGWIANAIYTIEANPKRAVVCGRRRERHPEASVYNRLADMEWDTPIGDAKASGGDALIRVEAFKQVGGYDPTVIAGEEPEMCVRLRRAGWKVYRAPFEMTMHDAAMTRFGQWWKRTVRGGFAYALGNAMHGGPPEFFRVRELTRIKRWAVGPMLLTAASVVGLAVAAPRWCWAAAVFLLAYPVLAVKTAMGRVRRGDRTTDSAIYGCFVALGRVPEFIGVLRFYRDRKAGRTTAIIEYKGPATPP